MYRVSHDLRLLVIFLSLYRQIPEYYLKLDHKHFLLFPFLFIIW